MKKSVLLAFPTMIFIPAIAQARIEGGTTFSKIQLKPENIASVGISGIEGQIDQTSEQFQREVPMLSL